MTDPLRTWFPTWERDRLEPIAVEWRTTRVTESHETIN